MQTPGRGAAAVDPLTQAVKSERARGQINLICKVQSFDWRQIGQWGETM